MTEYVHYFPLIGSLLRGWIIRKSRNYCNQYDTIITPSPSMKNLLLSYGVTRPIIPIPTGIDLSKFQNQYSKEELKVKYHIPTEQDFIFLYVSRIGKEKNVYFLLEAMRKLISDKTHGNIHLLLVGGGDELENAKNLVKKWGLSSQITFTGGLPKDETNKVFGGADCFVFASVTETQGIIIQEAQASGLPVIAVDKMGPSDYIHNGVDGFLIPLNLSEFTDKMEYILTHPEERKIISEKAKINVQEFTAEKSAEKMEKVYLEVQNCNRS
jgi:glycosyltransferase involved in cell wall biosynthesis